MNFVYFTHSLRSCWNHGNAHFLRGVLRELIAGGHGVRAYEPANSWSMANLLRDEGEEGLAPFRRCYPELDSVVYGPEFDLEEATGSADVVIVHEWTDPAIVQGLGRLRARGARFALLFHDTHHRAVSDPGSIAALDLDGYDGILAFGEALAEVYRASGWGRRVFVWHEAADIRLFRPPESEGRREGLVFVGNWGDGERTEELERYLLGPARRAGLPLDIHGVRWPAEASGRLADSGFRHRGRLPNPEAPAVFARKLATVHVPRRFYADALPGIPTIRVFEALACGIPLLSAPWQDSEHLFRPGLDFLMARDGATMARHMRSLAFEPGLAASLAAHGLETIRARHTCAHRVGELMTTLSVLGVRAGEEVSA